MLHKLLKIFGWTTAGLVGLAIGLYSIAVAINWRDQPPSADAVRFTAIHRDRPPVADQDNAFVYLMGADARPDADPRAIGRARVAFMLEAANGKPLDPRRDPFPDSKMHRYERPPKVAALHEACGPDSNGCFAAFSDGAAAYQEWLRSDAWVLERYLALIAHPAWREVAWMDVNGPIASYSKAVDGQLFLLLDAQARARSRDWPRVRQLLNDDLSFWRTVVASSDMLMSKMVAVNAVKRHFKLGSMILRTAPAGLSNNVIPPLWEVPMSEAERSMLRILVGEWLFAGSMIHRVEWLIEVYPEDSLLAPLLGRLAAPLIQPQDSMNWRAEHFTSVVQAFEVPWLRYPAAVENVELLVQRRHPAPPSGSLYNLLGRRLAGISDYAPYAARVADIEGVRRVALAALSLRAAQTPAAEVAQALATSTLRNPYTNTAFTWDQQRRSVVFQGLEPGERGVHHIEY